MREDPALAQILARLDAMLDRLEARIETLRDPREPDVPLQERGFGVMEESSGGATRRSTPS